MSGDLLYFMHPVNTYDTELEVHCLDIIRRCHPDWGIENPNQPKHQAGYERYKAMEGMSGMDYFRVEVIPPCRGGVFLAFRDGKVGAGIWKETEWILERPDGLLWEIIPSSGILSLTSGIPASRRLTVEETRARIRFSDGSRKPF